nr:hypothetical protein [Tanacetum cinerariifolium]
MDSNPIQPSTSTPVVAELYKEDQQATGGPTSLGVTSEEGAHPHLSSETTKSASEEFKTVRTQPVTGKGASYVEKKITFAEKDASFGDDEFLTSLDLSSSDDAKKEIKLEDLSLPIKLKDLPSKFNELTGEVKELKKHVHDLEIELPGDLKEIPKKLETFTSTIKSLTTQVAELETFYPPKRSSQLERELIKKEKGKEAMSSNDPKEEKLKKKKEKKRIEESVKDDIAKHEVEVRKEKWIDLLGVDVVTKYYKAKLQSDKYCDKMLNKMTQSRITNCDVLTRKGPITPKACPNRIGAGWSTIYEQIQTRMDYLHKTKAELWIDLDKPLGEQDPLDRLNDLARKKRKHAYDIHNLSRQDFCTIEEFEHFLNEMLYTVQEIFFRLHQGPGLDDHARTFSSLLLDEVDKRNLNPLKQIRAIKKLR